MRRVAAYALCALSLVATARAARMSAHGVTRPPVGGIVADTDTVTTQLHEATVRATRLLFVTKKDTVVYDMDALDAGKGEMLGDMISRMPGLELRDGTLYFKGRAVQRLLVGGVDFVRGDTKQGLRQLPAYIIKSVKAYESESDETKVTGIDNGVREQVVDVILKREYLGTWTGNADVAGGSDRRWRLRAFANTFTDNFRLTAAGGFTNTGQYQAADSQGDWGDNGGAGGSPGDTKYMRPALSMMWHNRHRAEDAGYLKIEMSGRWNYRGHRDYRYSETETFLDDGSDRTALSDMRTRNDEKIVQLKPYLTYRPTKRTHIEFSPSFSYTTQSDRSHSRAGDWDVPVYAYSAAALDSMDACRETGWPAAGSDEQCGAINARWSESGSRARDYDYGHWLWVSQQLTDNNWRIQLRSSASYSYQRQTSHEMTAYRYYRAEAAAMDPLYNRYATSGQHRGNTMNFLDLNIPLKGLETMRLTYGLTYNSRYAPTRGYRLERLGGIFADYDTYLTAFGTLPDITDWELLARDADITVNSRATELKHWVEHTLQYHKGGLLASVKNTVRRARQHLYYEKGDADAQHFDRQRVEYVLTTHLRYRNDSIGTFDLEYEYETQPQDLSYHVTLPDNSNPLLVTLGNPAMRRRRDHRTAFRYDRTLRHGHWLAADVGWNVNKNAVVTRSTYDKGTGVTTSQPVTVCGNWNVATSLNYNHAFDRAQRYNLNATLRYNAYNNEHFTVATDGDPLRRRSTGSDYTAYLSFSLRAARFQGRLGIDERYRLTHTVGGTVTRVHCWNDRYTLQVQYSLPCRLQLRSDAVVSHRTGIASRYVRSVKTVWNAYITRSLLRDGSLSLQLEGSDLLNQRDQSNMSVSAQSRSAFYSYCVGRFVMLHVIYRFSTGKKGA